MKVTTRIVCTGNRDAAREHIGRGRKEMLILENLMQFQGLTQLSREVQPYPGVVIRCVVAYNIKVISIYVQPTGEEKEEKGIECFCSVCFAMAVVDAVYEGVGNWGETTGCTYYDVQICRNEDVYVFIEGIKAVDAALYDVGQLVLVGPILGETDDMCCPDQIPDDGSMCNAGDPAIYPILLATGDQYSMWRWRESFGTPR